MKKRKWKQEAKRLEYLLSETQAENRSQGMVIETLRSTIEDNRRELSATRMAMRLKERVISLRDEQIVALNEECKKPGVNIYVDPKNPANLTEKIPAFPVGTNGQIVIADQETGGWKHTDEPEVYTGGP